LADLKVAYGFNNVRLCSDSTDEAYDMESKMVTMNELNDIFGITFPKHPTQGNKNKYKETIQRNLNEIGPLMKNYSPKINGLLGDDAGQEWRKMLNARLASSPDRFDIFERIRLLVQINEGLDPAAGATDDMKAKVMVNGLDAEIGSLLCKNSESLNKAIQASGGITSNAGQQLLNKVIARAKNIAQNVGTTKKESIDKRTDALLENNQYNKYLQEAISTHYFRNTSKLGLEFFGKQKSPIKVAFWLQDRERKTITNTDILQRTDRNDRNAKGFSEPITFSELREIIRMKARGEGGHIYLVTSATIPSTSVATSSLPHPDTLKGK
jgi:hypothetical protein